jgi:hypothetical protein
LVNTGGVEMSVAFDERKQVCGSHFGVKRLFLTTS